MSLIETETSNTFTKKCDDIDTTNTVDEEKEAEQIKKTSEKTDEKLNEKQYETKFSAGKNEFNYNLNVISATKQIASYGINIFSDGIEFTKQLLQKQQQETTNYSNQEIDKTYEIIDESLKNMIFTDRDHCDGQIVLMKSDTRIQQRIRGFLIKIGVELPISDWSYFDILITGILKCGTIKIINFIDKDLIGKILLGLCWIIPPFIQHFFDQNINKFISNIIIIHIHSFVCLLMIMFAIYDMVTSLNKYDWKKSILFSFILIVFSAFFYLLFYSQNIFNSLLCIIVIPFCWKFIKLKGGLKYQDINKYVLYGNNNKKLKDIYNTLYEQELYMNENQYVINKVCEITKNVVKKKKKRKYCSFTALLLLWICFVFKFCGHVCYLYGEYKIESKYVSNNEDNNQNIENVCSKDDILCDWIMNEIKLPQYLDIFREHGFETMDLICSLNENNLNVMQIYKQAHINLFITFTNTKKCSTVCENEHDQTCDVS